MIGTTTHGNSLKVIVYYIMILMFTTHVSAQPCVIPPSDITGWWTFDETIGATALDKVGTNHGTHINGPVPSIGKVNGALAFDGVDDYIEIPGKTSWPLGVSDFTIEFWIFWNHKGRGSIGQPGDIFIGKDEGPGSVNKWYFALGGGVLYFHIDGPQTGPRFFPRAPFEPIPNQWYHIGLTREGSKFTIYIDGHPKASAIEPQEIPNAQAPLTIGQAENTGFMKGLIDEMTLYNRSLTQEELLALFTADSHGKCKNITIQTLSLAPISQGKFHKQTMETVLGQAPFTWVLADGSLPSGMTLEQNGVLQGTPHKPGDYTFIIRVTDNRNEIAEKKYTLHVSL